MRSQVMPTLLLIPMLMTANCDHTLKNQTDVIVTYSNHADVELKPNQVENKTEIIIPEKQMEKKSEAVEIKEERDSDEVVFVPNEREVVRNGDYAIPPARVEEYMALRTVDDVMDNGHVRVETEPPNDVMFLSRKNNEMENTKEAKKETHGDTRRSGTETEKVVTKLNCTNLDCNSTVESVCGGKVEHHVWRYRLFLNECFFRKVNCFFKHGANRYHSVPLDKCWNVGAHAAARPSLPQLFPPAPVFNQHLVRLELAQVNNTRRIFSSRRSLSRSTDGKACSHNCPAACPDDYEPECAVSGAGQRRVFVNHCKLDYHSCTFRVVWHKRPLSECIGGKKADMRQNRGFIDWMQRVGIVDTKGRLVLS